MNGYRLQSDRFVDHGSVSQLQEEINLLPHQIETSIVNSLKTANAPSMLE